MNIIRSVTGVRGQVAAWRHEGLKIGVVPTMGALHEGHLSLLTKAREQCDRTVATLFVNPLQFGAGEDYETYPREEASDARKLEARGCDLLFAPSVEEMFPDEFSPADDFKTSITVRGLSDGLCGAFRPGHFTGVATEVTKLLLITLPDIAYFGEKDYQQLQVIARMARDLNLPLRVEGVPTVREQDGLAMSSRNVYLSAAERQTAPLLYRVLLRVAEELAADAELECRPVVERAIKTLLDEGFHKVEYLTVADADTLVPLVKVNRPARVLAAVTLGRARLIDNCPIIPAR
jgi:pantoate--beta-alanine ligase